MRERLLSMMIDPDLTKSDLVVFVNILKRPEASRLELATSLGYSKTTISRATQKLEAKGLIVVHRSDGHRKPHVYKVVRDV